MFPTECECHSDYELTGILIRLAAITPFCNPPTRMKILSNQFMCLKKFISKLNLLPFPVATLELMRRLCHYGSQMS